MKVKITNDAGWISKRSSEPTAGSRDCVFVSFKDGHWNLYPTYPVRELKDFVWTNRYRDKELPKLVKLSVETKEFFALSDYLLENYPDLEVTNLLNEIVLER